MIDRPLSGHEAATQGWAGAGWLDTSGPRGLVLPFGLAAAVGAVVAVAPWWFPIGLLLAAAALLVIAMQPLAGIALTFMLAFQASPASLAPDIPLGFFKLKPHELVLLWTIGAFLVRSMALRKAPAWEMPAFTVPMLFILFWVVVGTLYGKYVMDNGSMVLTEARGFLGLLVAPFVQLFVRDRRDIERLSFWISVVGIVLSVYILLQAMTGMKIVDGRVEALDQGGNSDITRSVVPGAAVQVFALYYLAGSLFSGRGFRFWLLPLILLVLLGLLATFGRGVWMTSALGALFVAFLAGRWRGLLVAVIAGSVMVIGTLGTAYVLKPRVAEAAVERALGIGHELSEGGSWGWRKLENERAKEVIRERPLLGVGIGGKYKQLIAAQDPAFAMEANFIHNSYLFFPLKMGVAAGLGPVLIAGTFALLLAGLYRRTSGKMGPAANAAAATVLVIFIGAVSGPVLKTFPGLLSLGAALAICAAAYRFAREAPAPASAREDREPARPTVMPARMNPGTSA